MCGSDLYRGLEWQGVTASRRLHALKESGWLSVDVLSLYRCAILAEFAGSIT
jgi:hypothetical protein